MGFLVVGAIVIALVGPAVCGNGETADIPVFGMVNRTFNCPLPDGCPAITEKYLTNYRYLNPNPTKECTVQDIKAALIKFQELNVDFKGLTVTGECDNITKAIFEMPRCGCEDIVKEDEKKMMPQNMHSPQEFRVGNKWSKTYLKWKVTQYPRNNRHLSNAEVNDAMKRALDIWAQQTPLTFEQVSPESPADIDIQFATRRHTAQPPYYDFDGKGRVLAHAFFPENGRVHFDDDENFVLNSDEGTELFIVAAHEFGHTLGISHSNVQSALMAPYYRYEKDLKLQPDDVAAVQSLYGARRGVMTTPAPTRPVPTTPKQMPDYCNMKIQASFKLGSTTYIFTTDERDSYKTVVYKVTGNGLDVESRMLIGDLFKKRSLSRWPRAHPYRVDAAAYIPDKRYIFLFSGTRAYRYSITSWSGPFYLDESSKYPRWMNVDEFPERPRCSVAMPLSNSNYYMLIFGSTMVWDWDFESQRVGAWAYPIESFGRNMPTNVDTAFLEDQNTIAFIRQDKYIRFNLRYRRVMDDRSSISTVQESLFKGKCV